MLRAGVLAALTAVTAVLWAAGAAYGSAESPDSAAPRSAPGELIVGFDESASGAAERAAVDSVGADIEERIGAGDAAVVDLPTGMGKSQAERVLERLPVVEYAEPNYVVESSSLPNDPRLAELWGMTTSSAPAAWDRLTGDTGVVVAVIDTGVDMTHADLDGQLWTNPGETAGNGLDDDQNGIVDDVHGADWYNDDGDPTDDNNHGTHVAGTIGAEHNNATGVAGVDPRPRIMALKFLGGSGSGYVSDALSAINYAVAKGAKVLNNSWGGGGYSQSMRNAIDAARAAGVLFVAAAGNSARNADTQPMYPAAYDVGNIISVASTTSGNGLSSFSNYGAVSVDLGAPGSSILSTVPGGGYSSYSGTSMASPHVAGAASLLWSQKPTASMAEVRDAMLSGAVALPALAGKTATGGRLDVVNALDRLLGSSPVAPPANTVAPTVGGSPYAVGRTMTCNRGTWTNSPTSYAFQWLRDGQSISGAAGSTYTAAEADADRNVACAVTATNAAGSATATGTAVSVAPVASPVNTSLPVVSGYVKVGGWLSCARGSWQNSPTAYGYTWLRDGQAITSGSRRTYYPIAADANRYLSCSVTATNAGGSAQAVSGAVYVPVQTPPANVYRPWIDGYPEVGGRLFCNVGWWSENPTGYSVQWLRQGVPIAGMVDTNYSPTIEDASKALSCKVTASNSGGSASVVSGAISVVAPTQPAPPREPTPIEEPIEDPGTPGSPPGGLDPFSILAPTDGEVLVPEWSTRGAKARSSAAVRRRAPRLVLPKYRIVEFTWESTDSDAGVRNYVLYLDGKPAGYVKDSDGIDGDAPNAILRRKVAQGSHYWYVKAVDWDGNERITESTSGTAWHYFRVVRKGVRTRSGHSVP